MVSSSLSRLSRWLKPWFSDDDASLRPVLPIAGLFFAIALLLGLNRYFSFFHTYDQGIFNQVFWNNLHGRFFQSSLSSVLSTNVVHDNQIPAVYYHRLGQHFTPALLLWLPFYALYPKAEMLVVIQTGLVTVGGLVLYALARVYVKPAIAVMISASYYCANAVIGPVLSNFHDLGQLPLMVFTLLLGLEKRRWWLVWAMAFCILMVREDGGVTLFGLGLYAVLSRRFPKTGVALCGAGFGYIVLVTNVLMALFSEDVSRRFMLERFGHFAGDQTEASSLDILGAILTQPGNLLGTIFKSPQVKVFYIFVQTLPFFFVPLRLWEGWAIAGLPFLQLLIQQGKSALALHIRYAITLVPGLCFGAILWWSRHEIRFTPKIRKIWAGCLALSVTIATFYNPHDVLYFIFPSSYRPLVYVSLPRQWEHAGQIRQVMAQIPEDASVAATTQIIPHLSSRRALVRLPHLQVKTDQKQVIPIDYAIADLWLLERSSVAFDHDLPLLQALMTQFDQVIRANQYGVAALQDKVILLKRGVPSNPEALTAWRQLQQEYQPLMQKKVE